LDRKLQALKHWQNKKDTRFHLLHKFIQLELQQFNLHSSMVDFVPPVDFEKIFNNKKYIFWVLNDITDLIKSESFIATIKFLSNNGKLIIFTQKENVEYFKKMIFSYVNIPEEYLCIHEKSWVSPSYILTLNCSNEIDGFVKTVNGLEQITQSDKDQLTAFFMKQENVLLLEKIETK